MRKNKKFVGYIIILSVVGLIILMITLFIVLQAYLNKNNKPSSTYIQQEKQVEVTQKVELSETFVVLIENINSNHIMGYDIYNQTTFTKFLDQTVKVNDAYGNVLPIDQLKLGDIVEVNYQSDRDKIISINKSGAVYSWNKISGVTVDTDAKQVSIGGTSYNYTDETMVIRNGIRSNIANIGAFDIVSIQAIEDRVWSITIEESSASLALFDLPTKNGQIEIDNSRLMQFEDIKEPIRLVAGNHRLVIKMQGYETITQEITVDSGQVYNLSLIDAKIAYANLQINMPREAADYIITIGEEQFRKGEQIKVQQGAHTIVIEAVGYEKYSINVILDKENPQPLTPKLIAIEPEISDAENPPLSSSDETSMGTTSTSSRTIAITSDPVGAIIFINGENKGTTPYVETLEKGTYAIMLQKEGYDIYTTPLILDGSNDQTSFLYQLTPIQ